MHCMKCGRDIGEGQAFCPACLEDMAKHPVRPGTVILLPTSEKNQPKKTLFRKKAVPSAEEQVTALKKTVLRLYILIFAMLAIIGVLAYTSGWAISELDIQRLLGQNYSTAAPTEPDGSNITGTSGTP